MAVPTFNDREQRVMAMAWQCMNTKPSINYEKLAKRLGLSNRNVATVAWNRIRVKLDLLVEKETTRDATDEAQELPEPSVKTPKKTPKKNNEEQKPRVSAKKSGRGKQAVKIEPEPDQDEESITPQDDPFVSKTIPAAPPLSEKTGKSALEAFLAGPPASQKVTTPVKRKASAISEEKISDANTEATELSPSPLPSKSRSQAPRRAKENAKRLCFEEWHFSENKVEYEVSGASPDRGMEINHPKTSPLPAESDCDTDFLN